MLYSASALALLAQAPLGAAILSVILVLLFAPWRYALLWVSIVGILTELHSPFVPLTFFAALLVTALLTRRFLVSIVTHRTLLGVLAAGFFSTTLFELLLWLFARVGAAVAEGWVPYIDRSFVFFVIGRVLWTTMLLALLFLITQRFSPKVRGVIVQP